MRVRISISACMGERTASAWKVLLCIGATAWGQSSVTLAQGSSADVLARMHACVAEKNDTRRLACFDEQMRGLSPGLASSVSSAAAPAASSAPTAATPEQRFGMNTAIERQQQVAAQSKPPPPLKKLNAHIKAISYKPQGEAVITLDNGEVWEEAEFSPHLPLHPGDEVTIKRGVLGSFLLYTDKVPAQRVARRR